MSKLAHALKSAAASFYWLVHQGRWGVKGVFDDVYEGQSRSETFRRIYRDVFAEDWAEEADPTGFLTMTDLRRFVERLGVGPGQAMVDLACGRGGSGLWVARATGASLIGMDISPTAIEAARRRIVPFGLEGRAQFQVGDFAATGLAAASCDGAMSVDSLYLVPDQTGSLSEAARILRPRANFVFTTWEVDLSGMVRDYRPLVEAAGFAVEIHEETPNWRPRQRAVFERILAAKDTLVQEMGEPAARFWIRGAQRELPRLDLMRRVFIAARKP